MQSVFISLRMVTPGDGHIQVRKFGKMLIMVKTSIVIV